MSGHNRILQAAISILLIFLKIGLVHSQTILKQQNPNEKIYLARTKQFNEFIDRFNYKTDFIGHPVDSVFMSKMPREKMIGILFDLKDPRLDPLNKYYSRNYVETKKEFCREVIQKNLSIYKYSDNIIAEARSKIFFNGKSYTISIFLSQEIVGNDMVKWVINNVKGDIFNIFKPDTALIHFIPPSSNETDFINLKRALEDADHLQYYASKDYEPDLLTLFFYYINKGIIKYEYVENLIYHIIDIPGWCIKVKEFNRSELNSGWLITDITDNYLNKKDYLKSLQYFFEFK